MNDRLQIAAMFAQTLLSKTSIDRHTIQGDVIVKHSLALADDLFAACGPITMEPQIRNCEFRRPLSPEEAEKNLAYADKLPSIDKPIPVFGIDGNQTGIVTGSRQEGDKLIVNIQEHPIDNTA